MRPTLSRGRMLKPRSAWLPRRPKTQKSEREQRGQRRFGDGDNLKSHPVRIGDEFTAELRGEAAQRRGLTAGQRAGISAEVLGQKLEIAEIHGAAIGEVALVPGPGFAEILSENLEISEIDGALQFRVAGQ